VKGDGTISSQAFRNEEMSVDRGMYRDVTETLLGFPSQGVARLIASEVRAFNQEVIADKEMFNEAHALVNGKKSKTIARALARIASGAWVVQIPGSEDSED
jgi:hypothetical protein